MKSEKITARELAVLALVSDGKKSTEIADLLSVARETVESHRSNIMRKLGAANMMHAVALAMRTGLIK